MPTYVSHQSPRCLAHLDFEINVCHHQRLTGYFGSGSMSGFPATPMRTSRQRTVPPWLAALPPKVCGNRWGLAVDGGQWICCGEFADEHTYFLRSWVGRKYLYLSAKWLSLCKGFWLTYIFTVFMIERRIKHAALSIKRGDLSIKRENSWIKQSNMWIWQTWGSNPQIRRV